MMREMEMGLWLDRADVALKELRWCAAQNWKEGSSKRPVHFSKPGASGSIGSFSPTNQSYAASDCRVVRSVQSQADSGLPARQILVAFRRV